MKSDGILVDEVPAGFEIYETPNAQVFLRRIQPRIITDAEKAVVEEGMKRYSTIKYYQIDVKKNAIIIFKANQDVDRLSELLSSISPIRRVNIDEALTQAVSYSPMMQFILVDEENRNFRAERYCFMGRVDNWIVIDYGDKLQNLVKKYVKHLGQDSYFELF